MTTLNRKDLILLALLTLFWGLNWPIMKIAVTDFPPIAFRTMAMTLGLPVIWLGARWQGVSLAIPQGRAGELFRLSIPNMIVVQICVISSVKLLTSGRAAILGYTMPVWAVLAGLLFFGERMNRLAWIGIACALGGALLLLSSELSAFSGSPLGTILAILSAVSWGYGTVVLKRSSLNMPTIALTFWMILMAVIAMALVSFLLEFEQWKLPSFNTGLALAYNALLVFGFGHVTWFMLARALPPLASSLSIMMIPVLGVFSGAWILDEMLHWQDYTAMVLILMAMATVLLKPAAPNPT